MQRLTELINKKEILQTATLFNTSTTAPKGSSKLPTPPSEYSVVP